MNKGEPWKLSESWMEPLSYFPADTKLVIPGNTEGVRSNAIILTLRILGSCFPQKFNYLSVQEIT